MPLSARIRYAASIGCLALLAAIIADVGLSAYRNYYDARRAYREYQEHAQSQREKAADRIADDCSVISNINPAFRECLRDKIRADQTKGNTNQDLQAQQDMAYWAAALFVLTIITTGISATGIFFLWRSLKQTRQAISIDREVGHAQVRAYLSVRPDVIDGLIIGKWPIAHYFVENKGQTPAYKVRWVATFMILPHPLPPTNTAIVAPPPDAVVPDQVLHPGTPIRGETNPADSKIVLDEKTLQIARGAGAGHRLCLVGIVLYSDVFGADRFTEFCFGLTTDAAETQDGREGFRISWEPAQAHNHAN